MGVFHCDKHVVRFFQETEGKLTCIMCVIGERDAALLQVRELEAIIRKEGHNHEVDAQEYDDCAACFLRSREKPLCGNQPPGIFCDLPPGHDGKHSNSGNSWGAEKRNDEVEPRHCVKCGARVEKGDAAHPYTCIGQGNAANPAPFHDCVGVRFCAICNVRV